MTTLRFTAELWRGEAQSGWFFVPVAPEASARIREVPRPPRGFGSVRVRATIGGTSWTTSGFPDASRGAYVLPVKKDVPRAGGLDEGDPAEILLEMME